MLGKAICMQVPTTWSDVFGKFVFSKLPMQEIKVFRTMQLNRQCDRALDGGAIKRLNAPTNIRIARSIRRVSRTTFWLSTVFFLISLSDIGWLTAVFAVTVVLAIFIYLGALKVGQMLTDREFATALAADPGANLPIILFLRSFDIARSSLGSRFMMEVIYTVQLCFQVLIATGPSVPEFSHRPYDVEENLDNAIGLNAMFVALGDRRASYGAAKITVKDEDWQNIFYRLANASQLIFMMPGLSEGSLWELWQIICSRSLLEKTVFIMPPGGFPLVRSSPDREWAVLSDMAPELGVRFPPYSREGCYFRLREDGQPTEIVALEPFTHALSKFVTSPAYTGEINFANVLKLV